MRISNWIWVVGFAFVGYLGPSVVGAQELVTMNSFEELRGTVTVGQTMLVTDESGRRVRGNVTEISQASITLLTKKGPTVVGNGSLKAFSKTDGLADGMWRGAAIGGLGAALLTLPLGDGGDVPPLLYVPFFAAFTVPAGLGIGALIDWAVRHDEMHVEYGRATSAAAVGLAPVLGRHFRGVSLVLRY